MPLCDACQMSFTKSHGLPKEWNRYAFNLIRTGVCTNDNDSLGPMICAEYCSELMIYHICLWRYSELASEKFPRNTL